MPYYDELSKIIDRLRREQEGGGSEDASTLSGATDTLTDKAGRNNKVVTLGT